MPEVGGNAYLNMIKPLAITLATPKYNVGVGYPGTMYLSTMTACNHSVNHGVLIASFPGPLTTEPARPPAIRAKPRNRTSLAFQATPVPE